MLCQHPFCSFSPFRSAYDDEDSEELDDCVDEDAFSSTDDEDDAV